MSAVTPPRGVCSIPTHQHAVYVYDDCRLCGAAVIALVQSDPTDARGWAAGQWLHRASRSIQCDAPAHHPLAMYGGPLPSDPFVVHSATPPGSRPMMTTSTQVRPEPECTNLVPLPFPAVES